MPQNNPGHFFITLVNAPQADKPVSGIRESYRLAEHRGLNREVEEDEREGYITGGDTADSTSPF